MNTNEPFVYGKKKITTPGWYWFWFKEYEWLAKVERQDDTFIVLNMHRQWRWLVDMELGDTKWWGPVQPPAKTDTTTEAVWIDPKNYKDIWRSIAFNILSPREKWKTWKEQKGIWVCKHCFEKTDDPESPGVFSGDGIYCGECDGQLTCRTSGGQSNPFNWLLISNSEVENKK